MGSLLERYRRDAVVFPERGDRPLEHRVLTDVTTEGWDDVVAAANEQGRRWKEISNRLREGGEPQALLGGLAGIIADVPLADLSAVTGGTANVKWWDALQFTPVPAQTGVKALFSLRSYGNVTSSAAAQTVTPSAHVSTTGVIGTNLTAATAAQTLGTTITNAIWHYYADLTVRTPGTGTAATMIGDFEFGYTVLAAGGAPTSIIWRSTSAATFDSTVQNGVAFGATPSAAGVSVTPRQIRWESWN
jgi:hypothetical protein